WRQASSEVSPVSTRSAIRCSKWKRSSESSWCSVSCLRKIRRSQYFIAYSLQALFGGPKNQSDGARDLFPIPYFSFELPPALARKPVKLGFSAGLGRLPFRLEPVTIFQPMKSRIKRSLLHLKDVFRYLLDALRDGVAVDWTQSKHLEDQHVQCPFEKLGFRVHSSHKSKSYILRLGIRHIKRRARIKEVSSPESTQ